MSGTVGDNLFRASGVVASSSTDYDDDQIQSNIAMLGFYVAVNGSLARYNLVDQSIDEYMDTSGVDASASTDEVRAASGSNFYYSGADVSTVTQDADATGVDGDYTWYKWTDTAATGSYSYSTTQDHSWLVVGGGGSGGALNASGGGAGGYRTGASLSLTGGNTYTVTVGAGGTAVGTGGSNGVKGGDSILSGTGITTITSTGGGYGTQDSGAGGPGGSGGGGGYSGGAAGAGNTPAITPISGETTTVQGYAGGSATTGGPGYGSSGGGGSSAVGVNATTTTGGDGGVGTSNSIAGSAVYYAGGGGGTTNADNTANGNYGAGANGRTQGGGGKGDTNQGSGYPDATANTGGGGGGGQNVVSGVGGSGIVVLRRLTAAGSTYNDMTLQSTDVTALSAPTYGEFVTLIENAAGTATLNTDIKGYISRDSGTTFTQGTLANEGSWGTNKQILAFHDLDISAQPSSTSMCYKIETINQSAAKDTRIWATSIGWR